MRIFDPETLVTEREFAERIGRSLPTTRRWRRSGDTPHFIKLGNAIFYRGADINEWLASQVRRSTSDQRLP